MKEALRQEVLELKREEYVREWWKEQYRKAKIEIKDIRFDGILKDMGIGE
jgi:hypothetical protein